MCWKCPAPIDTSSRIGFRDACPACGRDLHACRNCAFYLPGANHDCREDSAERVADKERANLCEYFRVSAAAAKGSSGGDAATNRAKTDFDKLFGGS